MIVAVSTALQAQATADFPAKALTYVRTGKSSLSLRVIPAWPVGKLTSDDALVWVYAGLKPASEDSAEQDAFQVR